MRREKSLRNGVHHANAVVWGPVHRTHLDLRLELVEHVEELRGGHLRDARGDGVQSRAGGDAARGDLRRGARGVCRAEGGVVPHRGRGWGAAIGLLRGWGAVLAVLEFHAQRASVVVPAVQVSLRGLRGSEVHELREAVAFELARIAIGHEPATIRGGVRGGASRMDFDGRRREGSLLSREGKTRARSSRRDGTRLETRLN